MDEPSPAVEPVYLRPRASPTRAVDTFEPAADVPSDGHTVTISADTLVDAITRRVLEHLTRTLHASVASSVRALAPHMLVSLGPGAPDSKLAVADDAPPASADETIASSPN